MTRWHGLTWDHPRGHQALRAALREPGAPRCDLHWDVQPLEGFEAAPIERTAEQYDLIVLDHPHVGEAVARGVLWPLDELFGDEELARWRAASVGASGESYVMAGRLWALPLDAAAQVSVRRTRDLPAPDTWDEAVELAADHRVRIPTAGPHPFLTLCAIAVANGARPGAGDVFLGEDDVTEALECLRHFVDDRAGRHDNPIALLDQMAAGEGPQLCPHVYGYVTYARASTPLWFGEAPRGRASVRGSVLGGTGIAFSARRRPDRAVLDHVRWLMHPTTQRGFLVEQQGQPGSVAAWDDEAVDLAAHGFYRNTRATIDGAWVRPRHPGAIAFQQVAADEVREALFGHRDAARLARAINRRFAASLEERVREETR